MKRPFACVGGGVFCALAFAAAFPGFAAQLAAVCAAFACALLTAHILKHKKTVPAALFCFSATAAAVWFLCACAVFRTPIINDYNGKEVTFSGIITSRPYTYGSTTRFIVKTDEINGEKRNVKIYVSTNSVPDGAEYDVIKGKCVLEEITGSGIGIDYASHYAAKHIFLRTYIDKYNDEYYTVTENEDPPIWKAFSDMRYSAAESFGKMLPMREASLCTAMITGDRSYLTDEITGCFRALGISHLLVVSGFHLSVVAALFYLLTRRLFKSVYACCAVQLAGVLFFAALTGFGFSVRRALVMFSVIILSRLFHSKADSINSLGLAAIIVCIDPFSAGDIGLLWSFSCTLSVVALADKMSKRLEKTLGEKHKAIIGQISVASAAFVGCVPFIVLVTKEFSPYTLAANLLTVPFTGIVILCSGFAALLSALGAQAVAAVPMFLAGITAKYLLFVTSRLSSLPLARISLDKAGVVVWFFASAVMLALLFVFKKRSLGSGVLLSISSLAVLVGVQIVMFGESVTISVLDTDGLTAIMRCSEGDTVLCSLGTGKIDLTEAACLIDVPRKHSGTRRILRDNGVGQLWCSDERRAAAAAWYEYTGGAVESLGDDCTIYLSDVGTARIIGSDVCEYVEIGDVSVLFYVSDESIPEGFTSPDIAVLTDDKHFGELSDDTAIIISGSTGQLYDSRIINSANEDERVDIIISGGGVKIKKKKL